MDTRLPYFDGQKDFLAFVRFLDNRRAFAGYIEQLDIKVAAFLDAAKLYGKAKEIEQKHAAAELWVKRAEFDYGERAKKLVSGEKDLAKETREKRAELKEREAEIEAILRQGNIDLQARADAVKLSEAEVAQLEQVVTRAEKAAEKKHKAAEEAKEAADAMVKRMKAVTAQ